MTELVEVPCMLMRGGTSKGVFIRGHHLPGPGPARDQLILALFGSPDARQIDGLGGAHSLTSKLIIVDGGQNQNPAEAVRYTFGQVSITQALIDYGGNCGNLSAAVGPYAIDQRLVKAVAPATVVPILNTNTGKQARVTVPIRNGGVCWAGDFAMDGVPGTGAKILLEFLDPGGAVTGRLFPTGNLRDQLSLEDGRSIEVTLLDAANPVLFARAAVFGLQGNELPDAVNQNATLIANIEEARMKAAAWIGLVEDWREATRRTPGLPKVALVAPAMPSRTWAGREVQAAEMDFCGRIMSMQKLHPAYAITGATATAVASRIPGTVVHEVCRPQEPDRVVIGHPSGTMEVEVRIHLDPVPRVESVTHGRTARKIMSGVGYVPRAKLSAGGR